MHDTTRLASNQRGFSLIEMMVSSTVMLLVLAGAMTALNHATRAQETLTLLADSNQALRAGTAFLTRDLLQAGWGGIPTGGVPFPTGAGSLPVNRPSPPAMTYTFNPALGVIPAVTPGAGLGPSVAGTPTDIVTILYVDNVSPLNQTLVTIAADGSSMTVPTGVSITNPDNRLMPGDLILFSNQRGYALQEVTRIVDQMVYFENTDVSKLNQRTAAAGTIIQLQTGPGTYPPTRTTRIKMITYFLDSTTDPSAPRLARQENYRPPRALAGSVDDLQLTYDLVDGVTNPIRVENPVNPGPNQIRKVNLQVGVRSEHESTQSRKFARTRVTTQVSLRSLAFVNRYL